jgi:protein SCO1/2
VHPRGVAAITLAAAFALGAVVLVARGDRDRTPLSGTQFEGSAMPTGVRAPDFDLRDQDGRPISMRRFRGKPVLVSFLYSTCRDTCPLQAETARGALDDLGHDVPAIAVSVDPPRDTPNSAKAFLSRTHTLGRIDWVLGTRAQLAPLWRGFAIRPQAVTAEHQARFTLVDKRGFQRIGFPIAQATPERLAHDLRLLERE